MLTVDHATVASFSYNLPPDIFYPDLPMNIRMFRYQSVVLTRIRQPVTIIEALAKIGGLLVVLRISIILRLINEYLFEKHLMRDLNSKGAMC